MKSLDFIISVIGKAILSLKELWDNNEDLRKALEKIWKGIVNTVSSAIKAIIKWWQQNGEKILSSISKVFTKIRDIIIKVIDGILKNSTEEVR